ncbi:GNAT family N-acetyltransferase, partial [Vibrio sp. F13]
MKVNIRPANENELELIHSQVISNDEWT